LAEEAVRALGFRILRVRHHGHIARVEVGSDERARADEMRSQIEHGLKPMGFDEVQFATYGSS
jgi:uncharacterized protein